ncbi:MAG: endonuclease III [Chromatiales bacterium]|jgi:endonuclease-3|nr:MAG: endonuclease III [Chromatiales bacterium]
MTPRQRSALFRRLQQSNPQPTTELVYRTPFELLISVILSAQATDVSVNKATAGLFRVANTPAAILALGEAGLKRHIRTIGLYNTKAKNILLTCQALLDRYGGKVPRERSALESLPGVGRKTANVVLNTAYGEPTIAVDTHIFRVANRTGLAAGKTPRAVEDGLVATTPARFRRDAHHWLILHGRYVCKARQPDCPHCPIEKLCEYPHKTPR